MINSLITFFFGTGVGSSVIMSTLATADIDDWLMRGVAIVTICLGLLKGYLMIKKDKRESGPR